MINTQQKIIICGADEYKYNIDAISNKIYITTKNEKNKEQDLIKHYVDKAHHY